MALSRGTRLRPIRFLRRSPLWTEVPFWSLDLETGGLDARHDPILSVGMVPIRDGTIRAGESFATLVRPDTPGPPSAEAMGVHHLVPGEYGGAPVFEALLPEIDARLREGVLLVHHARVDVRFLKAAFARARRPWPRPVVVDTVELLQKVVQQRLLLGGPQGRISLNLTEARVEFGLPAYPAHDALMDALATAELFLVLRARLNLARLRSLR